MSKKNEKDEILTVSTVYDTLKSPTFLKDLYWDVLASIKEKHTYKLMRETAEKLITQKADTLDSLTESDSDNFLRKAIVAQVCSMSYAMDTVYSKILYLKLEQACRSQIPDLIKELRREGKIPDEVWCKLKFKSDDSEPQISTENAEARNNSDKREAETPDDFATAIGKRKQKETETEDDPKVNKGGENVNNVNSKDVLPTNNSNKSAAVQPKKKLGGRIQAFPKKLVSEPVTSTPVKKLTKENVLELSNIPCTTILLGDNTTDATNNSPQNVNPDSDAESDYSMASVSSVHTSDLSSFDDEIILSSDEEGNGKKKRLSLKDLQEKLSQISSMSSRISKLKKSPSSKEEANKKVIESKVQVTEEEANKKVIESKDQEKEEKCNKISTENKEQENKEKSNIISTENKEAENKVSMVESLSSSAESATSQTSSKKQLTKRVRKPNSRYSSDNIVCASVKVKERKKSAVGVKNNTEKNSSDEASPQRKRPRIETDDVKEVPNETQKMDSEEQKSDIKSSTKQSSSSDVYKPQPAVRSLTSRRTAPVTLYSTAA